jgi:DNA-binding CsgD family transcriptional regulator
MSLSNKFPKTLDKRKKVCYNGYKYKKRSDKMTENERRHIVALWESRVPIEQIYRMLPYRRKEAVAMVGELRADGTLKPRKRAESAVNAVALAWQTETKSPYELAELFGYSVETVQKYLKMSGVRGGKRPTANYKHCDKTNAIMADLQEGKPMPQIARTYGVSRQYVHQIKQRMERENAPNRNV